MNSTLLKLIVLMAALVVTTPAAAQTTELEFSIDRFQLYTRCQKVGLLVESLSEDAKKIGLTKEGIARSVRSRLRGARIYRAEEVVRMPPYVYVNINVAGQGVSVSMTLVKWLKDETTDTEGTATTWDSASAGTHGSDVGYIINWLGRHVDIFIDEYLRVNEHAC